MNTDVKISIYIYILIQIHSFGDKQHASGPIPLGFFFFQNSQLSYLKKVC